jgi:hypothetical protein
MGCKLNGARVSSTQVDSSQPGWLLDMFGVSAGGKTYARRLFRVTNSHRKRGGPVAISLSPHLCPKHCVEVVLDGKFIEAPDILRRMLDNVEASEFRTPLSYKEEGPVSCKNEPSVPLAA